MVGWTGAEAQARAELESGGPPTAPTAVPVVAGRYRSARPVEDAWQRWRTELGEVGGRSPLTGFDDSVRTRIELATTHPSGLAQLITGRTTLLSNLIRDDIAFRTAAAAASAITAKSVELAAVRGIEAVQLAIGVAEWRYDGEEHRGPVLLRPLAIRRSGRDYELRLKGPLALNPGLVRALTEQFGIELDPRTYVALAQQAGVFKPQPVIDRLRQAVSRVPGFIVQPRLLISSFAEIGPGLVADARADGPHPVLDALAGDQRAARELAASAQRVDAVGQDDRPPHGDVLVLDADAEQEAVVATIASGSSLVVRTMPGTGATQTIVDAVGVLVAQHRRVLVVSPRLETLRGIAQRLAEHELGGTAVSLRSVRRDLIQSITRNEKAVAPDTGEVDEALLRLRSVLLDYRQAITSVHPRLGASVLDALEELSRLALLPTPPATTARLSDRATEALAGDRGGIADVLARAAALGEFRYGPGDSPWYGASFETAESAAAAFERAVLLAGSELPDLLERANAAVAETRLRPFTTIAELGVYLRLLLDIRETLDKFVPGVFDRSLGELIAATASRRDVRDMSGANRRRLKRLAREYVRPGVHVADLHDWLVRIQQQRVLHQRFVTSGLAPEVPRGIAEVQVRYQRVAEGLTALDAALGLAGTGGSLLQLSLPALDERIGGLARDSEALSDLQDRVALVQSLRDQDLEPLLIDLGGRHVPADQVGAELELAWWKSVLERLLAEDQALLGANTAVLDRLEQDFRLVDEAHAAANGRRLAWQLADAWRLGLHDRAGEAEALKQMLQARVDDVGALHRDAPHLMKLLAPVWLASPYEVHAFGPEVPFDTVIVVDAAALALAEGVGALRRARQVVAFGDPVIQTPAPFEIGVREAVEHPVPLTQRELDARQDESVFSRLAALLPRLELSTSYRAGGEDLADVVNRRFYAGRIRSLPWAGSFLGHTGLEFDLVRDGHGMPDAETGAVEALDSEVHRVVERVLDHALRRPRESLMVVSGSAKHAVRVQQAVLKALARRGEATDFFTREQAEPFLVVPLAESVGHSRDRVILSVGYGRTPHGRTLAASLGPLARPGGERLLAAAVTRARRSLAIVSCFRPSDLGSDRAPAGVLALQRLLEDAGAAPPDPRRDEAADAMLLDLARRLRALGAHVELGYRGALGLVAAANSRAIVVETDQLLSGSLRQSLRVRPETLKRLGWHYLRVHAFDLFSDPDAVARRVAVVLGVADPEPRTDSLTTAETDR